MARYKNFLVTGQGRAATTFLARIIHTHSRKWTVFHERGRGEVLLATPSRPKRLAELQERLNQDYYGEVSSMLRLAIPHLEVAKKLLLFRHPRDVVVSAANRSEARAGPRLGMHMRETGEILRCLDELAESGIPVVTYRELVGSPAGCQRVLRMLGVEDVEVTEEMLRRRVNKHPTRFASFGDLPSGVQEKAKEWDWFAEKYDLPYERS